MAKFKYRMQSILEIKKKLEEQAKNEFAAARAALNEEEEKLERLNKRKEAYEEKGRSLRENTLNIMDIIENKEALLRMDEFIADQQLNVKRAQDRMEEARLPPCFAWEPGFYAINLRSAKAPPLFVYR